MTTSFMNKISNDIEAQRSIKDSTLKLYMNTLSTLHNRLFDSKEVKSLSFLKDKENVIEENSKTIKEKFEVETLKQDTSTTTNYKDDWLRQILYRKSDLVTPKDL